MNIIHPTLLSSPTFLALALIHSHLSEIIFTSYHSTLFKTNKKLPHTVTNYLLLLGTVLMDCMVPV